MRRAPLFLWEIEFLPCGHFCSRASEVSPFASATTCLGKPVFSLTSCKMSRDVSICVALQAGLVGASALRSAPLSGWGRRLFRETLRVGEQTVRRTEILA